MQIDEIMRSRWLWKFIHWWSSLRAFLTVCYYDAKNRGLLLFIDLDWGNYWTEASTEARLVGDYKNIRFLTGWDVRNGLTWLQRRWKYWST